MTQLYGCIECGMLFAGWEYCLTHMEVCLPPYYLQMDKRKLKEQSMIGHRNCSVPSNEVHGENNNNSKNYSQQSTDSNSLSESTYTTDLLNPVEGTLHAVAAKVVHQIREEEKKQKKLDLKQQQQELSRQDSDSFDPQEQMMLQLFDRDTISAAGSPRWTAKNENNRSERGYRSPQKTDKPPLPAPRLSNKIKGFSSPRRSSSSVARAKEPVTTLTKEEKRKELTTIEKRLHRLIHQSACIAEDEPKMILLEILPKIYEAQFSTKIEYQSLGYQNLKDLLKDIQSISVVSRRPYLNIEHEYISFKHPTTDMAMIDYDYSTDDSSGTGMKDRYSPKGRTLDKYRPQKREGMSPKESAEDGNSVSTNLSQARTPQHSNENMHEKRQTPYRSPDEMPSSSSRSSLEFTSSSNQSSSNDASFSSYEDGPNNEDNSFTESSGTSCGSSRSVISAMADMLPNTNAYGSIMRVLSKNYPQGTPLGIMMQRAPEFRKFLNHCTDRRCEAQLNLAHSVLQQCRGISYNNLPDGSTLYFSANEKQTDISTQKSKANSQPLRQENLSMTPNDTMSSATDSAPEKLGLTPSSTYRQSSSSTPSTPQSVRERRIAENAERFLAEAYSFSTPKAEKERRKVGNPSKPSSNRYHISGYNQYFFNDEDPQFASLDHAPSSTTIESDSFENKEPSMAQADKTNPQVDKANSRQKSEFANVDSNISVTTTTEPPTSEDDGSEMIDIQNIEAEIVYSGQKAPLKEKSQVHYQPLQESSESRAQQSEIIEKIAMDLFPCTDMHYRLLVALAEHPEGMMREEVEALIPDFIPFLEMNAKANSLEKLDPHEVLKTCHSVRHRQIDGLDLYFINAPSMAKSPRRTAPFKYQNDEAMSVTSDITESSSESTLDQNSFEPASSPTKVGFAGADTLATMNFLRMLKREYRDRPWPASREQLARLWMRLDADKSSFNPDKQQFRSWLKHLREDDTSEKPEKSRKEALRIVVKQLMRLRCLAWDNMKFYWDYHAIDRVLNQPLPLKSDVTQRGKSPIEHICTMDALQRIRNMEPFSNTYGAGKQQNVVSVICEGAPEQLYLIEIGTDKTTYVFDCVQLEATIVCGVLYTLLTDSRVIKLMHGVHQGAFALFKYGGFDEPLRGVVDTQLAMEFLTGDPKMSFNHMLHQLGIAPMSTDHRVQTALKDNPGLLGVRPIPPELLSYSADHIDLLNQTQQPLFEVLQKDNRRKRVWKLIQSASDIRASKAIDDKGKRLICFDVANDCAIASYELLQASRPGDVVVGSPLTFHCDTSVLLKLLPGDLAGALSPKEIQEKLSDIVLDVGRPAVAWIDEKRRELVQNRFVSEKDLESIVDKLNQNRYILERHLHHISAVRNRKSDIIGLAMRVGRHIMGNADVVLDLLFSDPTKSILFVGEAGSGKTTILRETSRLLSARSNVCIIDTSNEIAGDGNIVHAAVGNARRLMVDQVEDQRIVMMQCTRSQKPDVIVVDEIDRHGEVDAARTCKRRGVRLIAGAYGSLRELMHDKHLSELVGGIDSTGKKKKTAVRSGAPIFDIIVELRRGAFYECRVILDTADAVDTILESKPYMAQRRSRDPRSGNTYLEYERL